VSDATVVRDNPTKRRYEILDEHDTVAGFTDYDLRDGVLTFVHTEVDASFGGQGIGSKLAAGALDDVRTRGLRVAAQCEFIAGYLEKHDEYADLLVGEA
jgi:uncharacterized protein